ncbi:MAG: hypothetical protein IGS48_11585 [Oscillatoriales cyanobacterium C42_A2020_001]|nr:hypothetical protein [Leptolyngbyaceae cyanobacterium C42_A2020_001]
MISVSPKKSARFLGLIIFGLVVANVLLNGLKCFLGRDWVWGFSRLFDLDSENNIPTWYSSITLLICSGLLAIIAHQKQQQGDRFVNYWRGLALIFLGLSIDEASSIHEVLAVFNQSLQLDGFLRFVWVIPAIVLLIIFSLFYWKFVQALPQKIKRLFLLAAALYISGAIVMEMIGGKYMKVFSFELPILKNSGFVGMGMALLITLEEFLEMCGVAVFIYALLLILSREVGAVHLSFNNVHSQPKSRKEMPQLY